MKNLKFEIESSIVKITDEIGNSSRFDLKCKHQSEQSGRMTINVVSFYVLKRVSFLVLSL